MTTVFFVLAVLVLLGAAMVIVGLWEPGITPSDRPPAPPQPPDPLTAEGIRSLRFRTGLRGYRMEDVDAVIEVLARQWERQAAEITSADRPGWTASTSTD